MTEIFQVNNGSPPGLMNDVFEFIEKSYSLGTTSHFRSRKIRTAQYGIETLSYLGPNIWNLVPYEYKTIESLTEFKAKIKIWVPENCPCRLCKTYIHQIGFIEGPRMIIPRILIKSYMYINKIYIIYIYIYIYIYVYI